MSQSSTAPSPTATPPKPDILRGWIKTTKDAILVFEATRVGIVPRVTRRFHELEKRSIIQSGAILIFTEEESGIKRWTDPYLWSASRMQGVFLMYREREDDQASNATSPYHCSAMAPPADDGEPVDPELEYYILGSWNKGKGLKKNGLMKKTVSMTMEGTTYHLISYYYPSDVRSGLLQTPSTMPQLASLDISPAVLRSVSLSRQSPLYGKKKGRPPRPRSSGYERPTGLLLKIPSASPPLISDTLSAPSLPSGMVTSASWPTPRTSSLISYTDTCSTSPSPQSEHARYHYVYDSSADCSHSPGAYNHTSSPHGYRHPDPAAMPWHTSPTVLAPSASYPHYELTSPSAFHQPSHSASQVVGREYDLPPPDPYAHQQVMRSWQPVLNEARVMASSTSAGGEKPPQDPVSSLAYYAGPVYH